ncbi:hypothetical protein [Ruegeria halocynthiae]|uniref:hypothetical protein n=1 Tax=Ruegeria halocynthiae TaxID=985054 RepID=UPI0005670D95|nr:hypothetical protein [Ruegeria halocynthiae]
MSEDIEEIVDFFYFADAYFKLCRTLVPEGDLGKSVKGLSSLKAQIFRIGPVYQNLGLATELTFKSALLLKGCSKAKVRKMGHDLSALHVHLSTIYDLSKVEDIAFHAAALIGPPAGILSRIESTGQPTSRWFNLSTHIKSLNNNYNLFEKMSGGHSQEKFRSRYPAKDRAYREVCVEAVMAGIDALLSELQVELNAKLSNDER